MKIALILVLGLSMALALTEESPEEIKSAVTGEKSCDEFEIVIFDN